MTMILFTALFILLGCCDALPGSNTQTCTRNGVALGPGQKARDYWGIKECFLDDATGKPAFRYVLCDVGGVLLAHGEETRDGTAFLRCEISGTRIETVYSACATSDGRRVEPGTEARDGHWFYRCVVETRAHGAHISTEATGCADQDGSKKAHGEQYRVDGYWMECRIRTDGGVSFARAGCQKDGEIIESGTEYLSKGDSFWRRCDVNSTEGKIDDRFIACNNNGVKVLNDDMFVDSTKHFWKRCEISDTSAKVTIAGCYDGNSSKIILPGEKWRSGKFEFTCTEENGKYSWNSRFVKEN